MRPDYADRELDNFIAAAIMDQKGTLPYTSDIGQTWQVVDKMMRKYKCELKLDVFLGVSGELWVASFYNPIRCQRYESKGKTASLAICRAAKEAFLDLTEA
ncbi:MAG: BC1872 family protein [Thermodesulfobacteriota bacterium]